MDDKGKIKISAIIVIGLLVAGYFVYTKAYLPNQSGVMVNPRMVVVYSDGTEETITPSLLLSVFYNSKPIVRIYTFWDITATVAGQTGTVSYDYQAWAQIGAVKMHVVGPGTSDSGVTLGTTHTLGYSSWVDSTEIQANVGAGTYTLSLAVSGTATSVIMGETLTKAFSAEVTASITVQNNVLSISVAPKGIVSA